MSIDKKLTKIQQNVIDESKQQEDELKVKIKKFTKQITENSKFLKNLEVIKENFK